MQINSRDLRFGETTEGRGGRRVRVIETAAPSWRRLAYALNLSSAVIQTTAESSLLRPDITCENALSRWMTEAPTGQPPPGPRTC